MTDSRTRGRAWLAAVVVLALLVVFQAFTWRDGALRPFRDGGGVEWFAHSGSGIEARAGNQVAFGAVVRNEGTTQVTLISLTLDGFAPADAAQFRRALVLDPQLSKGGLGAGKWPDPEFAAGASPINGYVLAPGEQADVVFVADVRRSVPSGSSSATLTYEQDNQQWRERAEADFTICPKLRLCVG